jgi:SUMO ligase MMS21 Smc5/6 complex component
MRYIQFSYNKIVAKSKLIISEHHKKMKGKQNCKQSSYLKKTNIRWNDGTIIGKEGMQKMKTYSKKFIENPYLENEIIKTQAGLEHKLAKLKKQ